MIVMKGCYVLVKQQIGVMGLAMMGNNLALNIESKGFSVSVYNWNKHETIDFVKHEAAGKKIVATFSIEEFVFSLEKPRKIILIQKDGFSKDCMVENLKSHLKKEDILIDGINTLFWLPDFNERKGPIFI